MQCAFAFALWDGRVAKSGQFPWSVQTFPPYGCTSSLLHNNGWVISAAHCLPRPVNGMVCRSLQRVHHVNCGNFEAHNMFYHPNWQHDHIPLRDSDILLIRLNFDLNPIQGFSPIPLLNTPIKGGANVMIAGFGQIRPDVMPNELRYADFRHEHTHGFHVRIRSIWSSTMPGDSGSGYAVETSNKVYSLGAVHCCSQRRPNGSVYGTSVYPVLDWIHNLLDIKLPPPPGGGCSPPKCLPGQHFNEPATNPRLFYNCHEGFVSLRGCGSGAFNSRRRCVSLPVPVSERFECQDWSTIE